jgi:hypothetical protein
VTGRPYVDREQGTSGNWCGGGAEGKDICEMQLNGTEFFKIP